MDNQAFELLKSRLDRIDSNVDALHASLQSLNDKTDQRLDTLEDSHAQMKGMAKIVVAIATGLSGVLSWVVSHVWKV